VTVHADRTTGASPYRIPVVVVVGTRTVTRDVACPAIVIQPARPPASADVHHPGPLRG
jgi:hypothetical protein